MLKKNVDGNIEVEKLTNRQIIKAWIAGAAQDLKNSLKHGGWRGAAAGFAVASVGMTFAACEVEKVNVQITEVGSLDQIHAMLGENFSVSEQIKTAAAQKFGNNLVSLMSENTNGSGKIVAFYQEDGMLKKATTQVELKANDFDAKIYEYGTFTEEGNTISFYQNNQEQTVDTTGKFVSTLPEGLAVIDTRVAETKIANAISAMQSQELNLQTDLDEVGKEDFKTLLGFVIEKDQTAHLPTLTLEYDRASNQTTATYSYLSLAGQTKIESGNIVFEGNLIENDSLNRTAAEEQLQTERAVINANRASVLEEATYTTLFELDNFDLNSVELEVAEKDSGGDESQVEISTENYASFDEFFADLSGENLEKFENAISETLRNGFTRQDFLTIFGGNSTLDNTSTFRIAFNYMDSNQIDSIKYVGLRNTTRIVAATMNLSSPIVLDNISVVCYSGDIQEIVENGRLVGISYVDGEQTQEVRAGDNQMFVKVGQEYRLIDYSDIINQFARANISKIVSDFAYTGSASLEGEGLDFFNICMPLAVAAGKIGPETKLSFVSVQGSSGTTSDFGSVYDVVIKAVDLNNDQLYNFEFIFDDSRTSYKPIIEEIKRAISDGQFRISDRGVEKIIPESDIMLEYQTDITEYTIPQAEAEETN
ncbi:MAG TPA: hypothetical protein IAA90_06660 [Candidatus Ornithoclostridium excrementipullorum]|nr:hypothetical protein [Candidatus Ornithoclostridium excrementipullorum]